MPRIHVDANERAQSGDRSHADRKRRKSEVEGKKGRSEQHRNDDESDKHFQPGAAPMELVVNEAGVASQILARARFGQRSIDE